MRGSPIVEAKLVDVSGNQLSFENGSLPVVNSEANNDAFARARVSSPYTIFDSKQIKDNSPIFFDDAEVSGSGTSSVYSDNRSSTAIAVGNLTAGKRIRQTFQRFNYQPGKSQLIIETFVMGATDTGITKEVGYFDNENGIFLRNVAGAVSLVVRSFVSGAAVDTVVPQASWNVDRFDGTGASGITLDPEKAQILFMDFEWLGVGTVRFGFYIDGKPYYVHSDHNANSISSVYMTTPNLPLRYSIENDGTGGVDSLEHICSTVVSEGSLELTGIVRSIDRGVTTFTTTSSTNLFPLVSIRLKTGSEDITVSPDAIEVFAISTTNYRWALIFNPTITGVDNASWTSLIDSAVEYDVSRDTAGTLSGGYEIASGYGSSTNQAKAAVERQLVNAIKLGVSIAGVKDELVLAVQNVVAAADIYLGEIEFRELL